MLQAVLTKIAFCRHEQVENAKRELRKEQALKKAYKVGNDGEAEASSGEDDDPDEDKLAEEEEAGVHTSCTGYNSCNTAVSSAHPPLVVLAVSVLPGL